MGRVLIAMSGGVDLSITTDLARASLLFMRRIESF